MTHQIFVETTASDAGALPVSLLSQAVPVKNCDTCTNVKIAFYANYLNFTYTFLQDFLKQVATLLAVCQHQELLPITT